MAVAAGPLVPNLLLVTSGVPQQIKHPACFSGVRLLERQIRLNPVGQQTGSTITDNTCVWTAIASAYEELAKLNPSAIIELFEVHLDKRSMAARTFTAFMPVQMQM